MLIVCIHSSSAKGKDLSMATSVLYALVMTVLSLSLLLSIGLAVGDYTVLTPLAPIQFI